MFPSFESLASFWVDAILALVSVSHHVSIIEVTHPPARITLATFHLASS